MNKILLILSLISSLTAHAKTDLIEGCQGEGCGCTDEKKTNKEFDLYEKMDSKSKILEKVKSGTVAAPGKATTKVISKGKSKVTEVNEPTLGLKKGDMVNTVFDLGEGNELVRFGNKEISFEMGQITLEEIEAPKYETWFEVKVGKLKGYSLVFPFKGCLE